MRVDWNSIVLNEYVADANGVFWYLTDLEGWDSPTLTVTEAKHETRHGGVIARSLLDARQMTLKGVMKAPTLNGYYAARHALTANAGTGKVLVPFSATEDIVRTLDVYTARNVRMTPAGLRACTFEVGLTAPDPLKYGPQRTVTIDAGLSATVSNIGNYVSERIVITCLTAGKVKVVNEAWGTRGLLTHDDMDASSSFNFLGRNVYDADGRPAYYSLAGANAWWGLKPGDNVIRNDGEGNIQINYYDAWL